MMLRIVKLIVPALMIVFNIQAQENPGPAFKKFGFTAGINFSHMNFNKGVPPPPVPVKTNWKPGIFFGFLLQVPVTKKLSIQPEYLFSRLGGESESTATKYTFDYLSMPVLLRYQFTPRISAMAGPQLDLLIKAKKDSAGISKSITHDTEERNIGLAGRIEFEVFKNLGVYAQYLLGLNHVGIGQRSELKEFKYEILKAGAAIRF